MERTRRSVRTSDLARRAQRPGGRRATRRVLPFIGPPATLLLGAFSRGCRIATAAGSGLRSSRRRCSALARRVRASGCATVDALPFSGAARLAVAFGPLTSDIALGQLASVRFFGARSSPSARSDSACAVRLRSFVAFAQPNVALGLVVATRAQSRNVRDRRRRRRDATRWAPSPSVWDWPIEYAGALVAHAAAERFIAIQFTPGVDRVRVRGDAARPRKALESSSALLAIAALLALRAARTRTLRALRRVFGARSVCRGLLSRTRSRRRLRRRGLVRASHARGNARRRARRNAPGRDRLARPSAAADRIAQSALLAGAAFVRVRRARRTARAAATRRPRLRCIRSSRAQRDRAPSPMPVWPDASAHFTRRQAHGRCGVGGRAARQRTAAAVPAWAFLRSLSLLGCALLAARYISTLRMSSNGVHAPGFHPVRF